MLYYIVELNGVIDNVTVPVLVNKTQLGDFVNNYDKVNYLLINVHGLGELQMNVSDFIKKDNQLEKGEKDTNA